MKIEVDLRTPVARSFRTDSVKGRFGLTDDRASECSHTLIADLPLGADEWPAGVGVIVGPSGSGKSSLIRQPAAVEAWGQSFDGLRPEAWPEGKAIVDGFDKSLTAELICHTLTRVGLGSVPSWLKPYHVLSTGERHRADLARALLSGRETVVFDEFTSPIDRTVAMACAGAVAKAVRAGDEGVAKRFVAVMCHDDVIDWLEPDWVLDLSESAELADGDSSRSPARGSLQRGDVELSTGGSTVARPRWSERRRPPVELEVVPCSHKVWPIFAPHHYLSHKIHKAARCHLALWGGRPVAVCCVLHSMGHKGIKNITRIVTLPDYQGAGIGGALLDHVAAEYKAAGDRISITTSHPAMLRRLDRSRRWRLDAQMRRGNTRQTFAEKAGKRRQTSTGRATAKFEFVG